MKSNCKKLGEFIHLVDERNKNLAISNLQGVSIEKKFIPSIANIIGTDLSNYKIVRTGQFAYGPVTSRNGDKISIALLKGEDCIISSSYTPFEVIKPDELLPEYLMMWFMRPEFDRYARYMSHGSAREVFDWECMCNVELPVPSLPEQQKIVHDYKVVTDRIELLKKINENLEKQVYAIYKSWFEDLTPFGGVLPSTWRIADIGTAGLDISDGNYSSKYPSTEEFISEGIPFLRGMDFIGHFVSCENALHISEDKHAELKKGHTKAGDILLSTRGYIGNFALISDDLIDVNINSQLVRINGGKKIPRSYLLGFFLSDMTQKEIASRVTGSAQQQLPIKNLNLIRFIIPENKVLNDYDNIVSVFVDSMLNNHRTIQMLKELSSLIMNNMSKR